MDQDICQGLEVMTNCRQMLPKTSKLEWLLAMSVPFYKEIFVPQWQVVDGLEVRRLDEEQ